jgi:hypothetical protein
VFLAQLGVFVALAAFGLPPLVGRTIPLALGATAAGDLVLSMTRGGGDGHVRVGRALVSENTRFDTARPTIAR